VTNPPFKCTELKIQAPSARAFRVSGELVAEHTPALIANLRSALNPRPKRLLIDIKPLTRIDRVGLDTLVGLAGVFDDADGYLALVGAPVPLQQKLGAEAPFRFFGTFAQGAVKVLDDLMQHLSGQHKAVPEKPETTEARKAVWSSIKDGAPGEQILTLSGNFDRISVSHFDRHWKAEFKPTTRNLIVELSELRTLVDEGTERFKLMYDVIRERGGRIALCGARPKIRVMLDMLDMGKLYEFLVSVGEAQERFARPASAPQRQSQRMQRVVTPDFTPLPPEALS
jgi:anti-anti-sigma regulatory factor